MLRRPQAPHSLSLLALSALTLMIGLVFTVPPELKLSFQVLKERSVSRLDRVEPSVALLRTKLLANLEVGCYQYVTA